MGKSKGEHKKNWNFPKRHLKEATKSKVRAKEREAVSRFRKGETCDIVLPRYRDCDDIWNYD